jgi:hypothetical protein
MMDGDADYCARVILARCDEPAVINFVVTALEIMPLIVEAVDALHQRVDELAELVDRAGLQDAHFHHAGTAPEAHERVSGVLHPPIPCRRLGRPPEAPARALMGARR